MFFPSFQDERQDKIHPFLQPQPLVDPYTEPIPYSVFPQNVLPLARPAMVLPFLQPEITEVPKAKQTMLPKRKLMPILESPTVPFMERQPLNPFALPLLQPFVHQVPRLLPQTPLIPPQSLPSLPQPKVLTLPQQVVPYSQRDMPVQALLLYQEPLLDSTQEFYPVTKPLAPVSNPIFVSPYLLILLLLFSYNVRKTERSRMKE